MFKKLEKILFSILFLSLISCGEMFMQDKAEKEVEIAELQCEMDTERIAQILRENISTELNCLQNHLEFFVDIVDSEKPGFLSYVELKKYLVKNMPEVDSETIFALSAVFDISELMFGEETGFIKKENISLLTQTLIQFNEIFVEANAYVFFSDPNEVSFAEHNRRKSKIYNALIKIRKVFANAYIPSNKKINLDTFIEKFKALGNEDVLGNIRSLIFLKRGILGGTNNTLSAGEFERLIAVLPDITKIAFDFVNIPDTKTEGLYQDEQILKILKEDIETVRTHFIFRDAPDEVVFTYSDIMGLIQRFLPEAEKLFGYKNSILVLKEALLGDCSENFFAKEIMVLLDEIIHPNLEKGVHFYQFYEQNQKEMSSFFKISRNFKLKHYVDFKKERQILNDFNRIARNYHFYLGSDKSPTYDQYYKRNPRGVYEVAILESLITKLFKSRGTKSSGSLNGYGITLDQITNLMDELKEMFVGEGWMLVGRQAATAETMTLMSSLFQFQSDGDDLVEVNEFTEFAITLFTSMNLSDSLYKNIEAFCPVSEKGTYSAQCFRDNIKDIMDIEISKGKTFKTYLPLMNKYINNLSEEELQSYFLKTANYSRTCAFFDDGVERPMDKSDGLVTWAGFIAIEQSVVRYDTNNSQMLEPNEQEAVFKVFKDSIKALMPEALHGKVKEVFQYMIKFETVPEPPEYSGWRSLFTRDFWRGIGESGKFAYFAWLKRQTKRQATADRMTLASLLEIIAEQSPANLANPYPCETLR